MSEIIHELIFDFVNGKTKSFKFDSKEEANSILRDIENNILYHQIEYRNRLCNIKDVTVFVEHICSITYNSYPKPKDEEF